MSSRDMRQATVVDKIYGVKPVSFRRVHVLLSPRYTTNAYV